MCGEQGTTPPRTQPVRHTFVAPHRPKSVPVGRGRIAATSRSCSEAGQARSPCRSLPHASRRPPDYAVPGHSALARSGPSCWTARSMPAGTHSPREEERGAPTWLDAWTLPGAASSGEVLPEIFRVECGPNDGMNGLPGASDAPWLAHTSSRIRVCAGHGIKSRSSVRVLCHAIPIRLCGVAARATGGGPGHVYPPGRLPERDVREPRSPRRRTAGGSIGAARGPCLA